MTEYVNSGILFSNDKKGNPKAPDWTGKINIDGVEKRLAAWERIGKKGKFLTLNVSELQPKSETPPVKPPVDDLDDEIPF